MSSTSVRPPRPAPGSARVATTDDRALLRHWMDAFAAEALRAMPRDAGDMQRSVDARVGADATGGFTLWELEGRPVSLTGWMPVAGGARIGPVYTPPEQRVTGTRRTWSPTSAARCRRRRRRMLPVHRSREPDLERDLPSHRLRAGGRVVDDPVRRTGGRARLAAGRRRGAARRHHHEGGLARAAPCPGIRARAARDRSGR